MTKGSSNGDTESNKKMEDDKDRQHYPSTDLGSSESQFIRKVNTLKQTRMKLLATQARHPRQVVRKVNK